MAEVEFKDRLIQAREAAGLTRARLAQRARVSYAYIQQLEQGHRKMPSADKLQAMAEALGTTTQALLQGQVAARSGSAARGDRGKPDKRAELLGDIEHILAGLDTSTLETVRQIISGMAKVESRSGSRA